MSYRTWITTLALGILFTVLGISILGPILEYVILFGFSYSMFAPFVPWGVFSFFGGCFLLTIAWIYTEED